MSALASPYGAGAATTGGDGGTVLTVTRLDDPVSYAGSGSLRAALLTSGARIIRFAVGGIIWLRTDIENIPGDVTVEGQSAPAGGICIANGTLGWNATAQVKLQNIRVRLGAGRGYYDDCVRFVDCSDVLVQNCSFSWGLDEVLSFTAPNAGGDRITVQQCIIASCLPNAATHQYCSLLSSAGGTISYVGNILANAHQRMPAIGLSTSGSPQTGLLDFRYNLAANWVEEVVSAYMAHASATPTHVNCIGNWFAPGPNTPAGTALNTPICPGQNTLWYLSGNYHAGQPAYDQWDMAANIPSSQWSGTPPATKAAIQAACDNGAEFSASGSPPSMTATEAYAEAIGYAGAGAYYGGRDAYDERLLAAIATGTLALPSTEASDGGYPALQCTGAKARCM